MKKWLRSMPLRGLFSPEMNPILIKELRQAVRSRFVTGAFLLFLAVQLLVALFMVVQNADQRMPGGNGQNLFLTLLGILSFSCFFFIPYYTGIRLASERGEHGMDLFFITTIRAQQVVWGKLLAGVAITVLLFSATMPYMFFAYLLRGIDLFSILVVLGFVFVCIFQLTLAAIFLASLPVSRVFRILLALGAFWAVGGASVAVMGISSSWFMGGIGSRLTTVDFWENAALVLSLMTTGAGLLYWLAVALLSPASSNQALPVRIYATVAWLAWGVLAVILALVQKDAELLTVWLIPALILLMGGFLAALGENPDYSARVRRQIPVRWRYRLPAFLFYSGPAGGVVWSIGLAAVSVLVVLAVRTKLGPRAGENGAIQNCVIVFLYLIFYGFLGLFLWRKFLHRFLPRRVMAVPVVILAAIGCYAAFIIASIQQSNGGAKEFYFSDVFEMNADLRSLHFIAAASAATLAFLLNMRWMWNVLRDFKPLEASAMPSVAGAAAKEDADARG